MAMKYFYATFKGELSLNNKKAHHLWALDFFYQFSLEVRFGLEEIINEIAHRFWSKIIMSGRAIDQLIQLISIAKL